jgi:uncharacterized membrane protein HdeD (DUF308 family)
VSLYDFLSGAVCFGFFTCALFFMRFRRRTGDGLFLLFALAFAALGIGQALVAFSSIPDENRGSLYLVRLAAFLLILLGIYRANRQQRA